MKSNRVIIFICLISLGNKYLKYWKIKIHKLERDKLPNCDIVTDPQFDKDVPPNDINISYNLGEKSLCLDEYQFTTSFLRFIFWNNIYVKII